MNKDFPYLEIPEKLKPVVGEPDSGTRMYRCEGSEQDGGPWFEAINEHFPGEGFVSPGGVGMFAPVSRAGVYKRLREGKLTAFCFHVVEAKRTLFTYQKKVKLRPYMYIPVSECKAWGEELRARPDRKEAYADAPGAGQADLESEVLDKPAKTPGKVVLGQMSREELVGLIRECMEEIVDDVVPAKLRRTAAEIAADKARFRGRRKNAK